MNNEEITIVIKINEENRNNCSGFIRKKFAMLLKNIESGGDLGFDKIDKKGKRVANVKSSMQPVIINKILKKNNFFDFLSTIKLIISKNDR